MRVVITSLFGLESLIAEDLVAIGYDKGQIKVTDGQVVLLVDDKDLANAVARVNLWVRTGERVLVEVGNFPAYSFDDLYEGIRTLPWSDFIPLGYAFHVNGYSRKSKLFGISACQSITKKAIVDTLLSSRKGLLTIEEDETIGLLKIQIGIVADQVSVMIDTSGQGLHKRGYRPLAHEAPIRETLAAGLVRLSRYNPFGEEALVDPFCGSGTIPIEAALLAFNIAPGLERSFSAENWPVIGRDAFARGREEAKELQDTDIPDDIYYFASDIDPKAVAVAKRNSESAGVSNLIRFEVADAFIQTPEKLAAWTKMKRQLIICNPPYGERLLTEEAAAQIYHGIAQTYLDSEGYCKKGIRLSVISPDDTFEKSAGRAADKRRKLYNGNIRCQMYHYFRLSPTSKKNN